MTKKVDLVGLSLSKALKVKSRLAGRLSKVTSTIGVYNSAVEGRALEVNVNELDMQRGELVKAMVELKTAISLANNGIINPLNQLSEKKGEIDFLNTLNTRHGSEPNYQGGNINYIAVIKKQDVDKRVKLLEKEVDDLQDFIDKYNAEPERIRVDSRILELAS